METWNKHTKLHANKQGLLKIQEAMCTTNKCVESSNQFVSVFTNSSPINSPDLGLSLHLPMEDIPVTIFSVTELLCYLKSHKATWLIQFSTFQIGKSFESPPNRNLSLAPTPSMGDIGGSQICKVFWSDSI